MPRKRKPGRPKGSKNKRGPGRPKGSKNRHQVTLRPHETITIKLSK